MARREDLQKKVIEHARNDIGATEDPAKASVVAGQQKHWWDKIADHIIDRVVPEVGQMISQKLAHGGGEIMQAIHTGSAYTPYGYSQKPLQPVEVQAAEGHEPSTVWQSYLKEQASHGHDQNHDRRMDR
jgi:hypothetical protein